MQETQIRSLDQEDSLEKEMATHSSILAWKIPWAEEPGRLQSMGVTRVGHDLVTKPPPRGLDGKESVCSAGRRPEFNPWVRKIPWRSEQLPIPVFLPREFHGQRSLVGYSPWGQTRLSDFTSPDVKSWLTGKDPDAEKDWGQEEKGWQLPRWLDGITEWTWVWASPRRWWRTWKPGML